MERDKKCSERIAAHWALRKKDFEVFMRDPEGNEDLGPFYEYGLGFDYVAPNTFKGQRRGYWRYQLSWGGPSDELRFYGDEGMLITKVEYWFLDWFDGAHKNVTDVKCVQWLIGEFEGLDSFRSAFDTAAA